MQFKASILCFCLFIYLTELATLPAYCMPAAEKETSCPAKKTYCSAGATDSPCKKPVKDNTDSGDNNCSLNCPLCYVMTFTSITRTCGSSHIVKKDYPVYRSTYRFIYYATAWKPPNRC